MKTHLHIHWYHYCSEWGFFHSYSTGVNLGHLMIWLTLMPGFVMTVLLAATTVYAQEENQQVYVLDHPIDPDLLILSTPDGNYPFMELAGTDCSWVLSDTTVTLTNQQDRVWTITDGADAMCNLFVGDACTGLDSACEVTTD